MLFLHMLGAGGDMKKALIVLCIVLVVSVLYVRRIELVHLDRDETRELVILTRDHRLLIWDEGRFTGQSIANLKPWKLAFGDINDDGINEIAIGAFKQAPLHRVEVKRAFFYALRAGKIVPVLRMSRTYEPLVDFFVSDHLATIETDASQFFVVHYRWAGFGFEIAQRSGPYPTAREAEKNR